MDSTKKKKLLVIVGIIVVAVAALIVLFIVIKNSNQVGHNDQAERGSDFVEVKEEDTLNTDKISTKEQVASALGDNGSDITEPEVTPVLRLGDQLSQTATYTFTMINGEKAMVNIDARTYPDKETMDAVDPFSNTEPEKIEGVGEEARWLKKAPHVMQISNPHDTLMAVKGTTSFAFQIVQPREGIAIEKSVARDIVLEIAKQAKLEAVK